MENTKYENEDLVPLYNIYMEAVALATFLGLIFPLIFLWSNQNKMPYASTLELIAVILVVLCFLLYQLSTGEIFSWKLTPKIIRRLLYGWGLALLGWAAWIVYITGGIQSSIFVWLFEYAFIVTIIVRPKYERTFFKEWRPVLFAVGVEILFIVILVLFGGRVIQIPNTMEALMPIWGGFSVSSSLILSVFLFYIYPKKINKFEEGVENV